MKKLKLIIGSFLIIFMLLGALSVQASSYDYKITNCYDQASDSWSTNVYCETNGTDCSSSIPHPCPPPGNEE
ncbi:MAG: hypothetical protein Sapg2KO_41810 [Saprospiraceae bacterium]